MLKKLTVVFLVLFSGLVFSHEKPINEKCINQEVKHSGGTDKCGCHFNRKTGEYHCHNRKQRGSDCPA